MGTQSDATNQIMAVPRRGGALHGIGGKFSPDLYTGTGNFTVPIAVPPGRNSFQPQLSLSYGTGRGNGPFGLGWSLTVRDELAMDTRVLGSHATLLGRGGIRKLRDR